MSTEVQKQEVVQARGFQVIEAGGMGPVAIVNSELVTPKTIGIFHAALEIGGFEKEGHGIASILLRDDGFPMAKEEGEFNSWMFYPGALSAVCNLQDCVEMAIATGQDAEKERTECISVYALTWKNIIQGFVHEAHHANAFVQDGYDKLDDAEWCAKEEQAATEYARTMMYELAKMMDVEPEFSEVVNEVIGVFMLEEIEAIDKKIAEGTEVEAHLVRWAEVQRYMLEHGGVYYEPKDPEVADDIDVHLTTFKQFLHFCSGDAEDDKAWQTETIGQTVGLEQAPSTETASGVYVDPQADPDYEDDMPFEMGDEAPVGFGGVGTTGPVKGFEGVNQTAGGQPTQPTYQPAPNAGGYGQQTGGYGQPQTQYNQQPAAQTQQYVAPTANPNVQVGAKMYPAVQLPASVDPKSVVYGLYQKIAAHIFQNCGFNPTLPQGSGFANPQNIYANLPLDTNEAQFVHEMVVDNGQGGIVTTKVNGAIVGRLIDKMQTLPAFELVMQTPDGQQIKRKFIPQNPNKMVNGAPTATAQMAKDGHQILWIIDPDTKAYNVRVLNNVVQQNVNRQWV